MVFSVNRLILNRRPRWKTTWNFVIVLQQQTLIRGAKLITISTNTQNILQIPIYILHVWSSRDSRSTHDKLVAIRWLWILLVVVPCCEGVGVTMTIKSISGHMYEVFKVRYDISDLVHKPSSHRKKNFLRSICHYHLPYHLCQFSLITYLHF
jgi:hypothetical protein